MSAPGYPAFGTNGIRSTLDGITPDFIVKICASFATWSSAKQVLVARDTRTTGELVEGAVASGLLWGGAQPVLLGVLPTPAVEYLSKKRGVPSIIITSSHNPPEWVALKFNDEKGVALTKERGREIENIYESRAWKTSTWDRIPKIIRDELAINEYKQVLKKECKNALKEIKVIIDCGNGTAGKIAPYVFKELGAKVITLNAQEDGFFPGRNSEPTEQNVGDLIGAVKTMKADLGIAYDGDGDRLALVDDKGNYVLGDKVFAIAVDIILNEMEGDVVTTVATSNIIRDIAAKHGRKVKYVKVGAPYIAEEMEKGGYATGGEEVGGIIWPNAHPGKDGILSSIKITEYLASTGKKLSEIVDALPKYENVKIKIPFGNERFGLIRRMQEEFKEREDAITIDGVRIDFEDGWCIARASGTENYVRVFGEAKTKERAEQLVNFMKDEIEKYKLG